MSSDIWQPVFSGCWLPAAIVGKDVIKFRGVIGFQHWADCMQECDRLNAEIEKPSDDRTNDNPNSTVT